MFVLGYPKEHMVMPTADGGAVLHYWGTEAGQQLWQKLFNAIPQGSTFNMGTDMEVFVDFAYGYVPKVTKRNRNNLYNKYLEPKVGELKEYKPTLLQNIETFQPDIIVPMHSLATKQIMGSSQITQVRGKPEKIQFGNHECWVLSTFSMDAVQVVKKNEPLQDIDLNLIMRFLAEGESTFISDTVKYVTLTNNDYDEIIRLLSNLVAKKDANVIENAVAWDLETNTLRPEYSGSKILTFSFSDDHAVGYTLPVDHPEQPWTEEQRNTIMDYIFQFIRSDIYKVGANIQFDMKYTKMKSPEYLLCKNNLDVQAGFYIAVSQDSEATKSLKTLVYYYTDMGGYDAPVDGYKHFFKKVRTEIKKRYNKRDKKPEEYQAYLDNGLSALGLKTPDYMNEDDVAVMLNTINKLIEEQGIDFTNPVDGEDFTYEWIPYRLLAEYASGDVDATRRINVRMVHDEVSKYDKWITLYKEHYPELMNTLADMEVNGMQVDENRLLEIKEAFKLKQEEIYKTVQSHALVKQLEEWKEQEYMEGLEEKAKKPDDRDPEIYKKYTKYRKEEDRKLNINSPTDKGMLMFMLTGYTLEPTKETLKDSAFKNIRDGVLKKSDVNWTHFKTDSDNVERLMEEYGDFELGKLLLEYGKATKLVTTYTQGILDITDDDTVVHGSIKSTRTATTRLAISSPSLQNIPRHIGDPRRYDYRYPIKSYYVPTKKDNHDVLILLDYSAQELRVASLLAKDEDMQRAFLEGKDVHKETASIAFGVPIDEVTSDLRSDAKAVS